MTDIVILIQQIAGFLGTDRKPKDMLYESIVTMIVLLWIYQASEIGNEKYTIDGC